MGHRSLRKRRWSARPRMARSPVAQYVTIGADEVTSMAADGSSVYFTTRRAATCRSVPPEGCQRSDRLRRRAGVIPCVSPSTKPRVLDRSQGRHGARPSLRMPPRAAATRQRSRVGISTRAGPASSSMQPTCTGRTRVPSAPTIPPRHVFRRRHQPGREVGGRTNGLRPRSGPRSYRGHAGRGVGEDDVRLHRPTKVRIRFFPERAGPPRGEIR